MANLRDIKTRIKSIKNAQKITQAMRMVAAAKVKKAERKAKEARPYAEQLVRAFRQTLAQRPIIDKTAVRTNRAIDNYPALLERRELQTVGILVITSDKGLAGAYNTNIIKKAIARVKEVKKEGKSVKIFIIGNKGIIALKREFIDSDVEIIQTYSKLPAIPTAGGSQIIAEDLAEAFVDKQIDNIEVITTKFISMLSYKAQIWELLPVAVSEGEKEEGLNPQMVFEPSPEVILQNIVPLYISNSIYQAMVEASASELAARMSAMANATNNASDMINNLTIVYNKERQAAITQEISEVVGGAEALNG